MVPTPTGLEVAEYGALSSTARASLARWHATKAGNDDGRPWWPEAIRALPLGTRLTLATNREADVAWEEREAALIRLNVGYFVRNYGHIQDEDGAPEPFVLWPEQYEVLEAMNEALRLIVLKARQLGLTWLALHYAYWLMAFKEQTRHAKVLALSRHGEDAKKLLERARRIHSLLPPFLSVREERATRDSLTRFKLQGRGEMISLSGSPGAARSETATLAILDEFAFIKNRQASATHTAVQPSLGQKGQEFIVSTGNGPPESPGDGQAMAKLWADARSGRNDFRSIFLPTSTHPKRDKTWLKRERGRYLTDEEFYAEHPEAEGQAMAGKGGKRVYPPAGINAAERLGKALDAKRIQGKIAPPVGEQLYLCFDWGLNAHGLLLWPLEGGGFYVVSEFVYFGDDIRHLAPDVAAKIRAIGQPVNLELFDASMPGLNKIFADELRAILNPRLRTRGVPFGKYKSLGIDYLLMLFRNAVAKKLAPVIAISPACKIVLRQLRGLEYVDDDSGKVDKGDDHGPDALIAGVVPTARRFKRFRKVRSRS